MAIFRGLNVAKGLADIDNPRVALGNLGLNREDFDLIAGLTQVGTNVSVTDFHAVSGLTVNQQTELNALASAAEKSAEIVGTMNDISIPMEFNLSIDNKLVGGAIKFNYLDFQSTETVDSDTVWKSKGADISTSRISSWSAVGTAPNEDAHILYGGEVKVTGDSLSFNSLETLTAPIAKAFRAEVPTHIIKVQSKDGSNTYNHQMLAMKGIPLTWNAFFRDADLKGFVTAISDIPITWRITNKDGSGLSYNSGDGTTTHPGNIGTGTLTSPAVYAFRDTASKARTIEFFYDPSKVQRLDLAYLNMIDWTNVSLPALKVLNLEGNDFSAIPEFRSDATTAKSGFSNGAGLATALEEIVLTGNNLSRAPQYLNGNGFTSTTSITAGTASAQLNRLPTTMKSIKVNGCFQDSTPIDLLDYENLETLMMQSEYQRDLSRRQPSQNVAPATYDTVQTTGARPETDFFGISGNSIKLLNMPVGYIDKWFKFQGPMPANSENTTGNIRIYVRYDLRVGPDNVMGTAPTNLADGGVYVLQRLSNSDTTNLFTIFQSDGTTSIVVGADSTSTGGHSFTRCNSDGTDYVYDSNGVKSYDIKQQNYKHLPPGVYRSPNLTFLDIRGNDISRNSESPYYDRTNTTTKNASSADMAIPAFASSNIVSFYSDFNHHNVPDMSNKSNLEVFWMRHNDTTGDYRTSEKTYDGKFDGCINLRYLNLYNLKRAAGNYLTNGMFQAKPRLYFADTRWGWGHTGSLKDDILTGSDNLQYWFSAGAYKSRYTNDFFGCLGSTGFTGKMFINSPKLQYLYAYYNQYSSGVILDASDDTKFLDLSACTNLKNFAIHKNDMRGRLPSFQENQSLRYVNVSMGKLVKDVRFLQPGQTYTIISKRTDGVNATKDAVWATIGWQGGGATDPVDSSITHSGTTPAVGQSFVATSIDPKTTQLVDNERYFVRQVGTHTTAEWNAIMDGTPTIYQGRVFTANGASAIGGSNSGAEVLPYTRDRVQGRGFTGTLPALDLPQLRTFRINENSFSGQLPKLILPYLYNFWLNQNEFTGSIPDFSSCIRLRNVRAADNRMSTYDSGNLKDSLQMRNFDFSNNKLRADISTTIIDDLYSNYLARNRGGVTLNFLGQNADSGDSFSEQAIIDDGTDGPDSSANKLAALRSNGWTILLDAS